MRAGALVGFALAGRFAQELALLPRIGARDAAGDLEQARAQRVVEVDQQAAVGEHVLEEAQGGSGAVAQVAIAAPGSLPGSSGVASVASRRACTV